MYLDYLETEGITKADSAFVSHYHQDHVQGIIAAMENIKVRNLFLPDNMEGSEWREALENTTGLQGLTCKITFDPKTHMVYREVPICQIENGGFKTIGRFTPSMQK